MSRQTDFESDYEINETNDINEQTAFDKAVSSDASSLSSISLANRIWTSTGKFLGWNDDPSTTSDSDNTLPLKRKKKRKITFFQSVKVVLIPSMVEYNKAELTPLMVRVWCCV